MKVCVYIRPSQQGGFVAMCQTLPGCIAWGETRGQARQKLEEAIEGYLAAVGDFVPATMIEETVEV